MDTLTLVLLALFGALTAIHAVLNHHPGGYFGAGAIAFIIALWIGIIAFVRRKR